MSHTIQEVTRIANLLREYGAEQLKQLSIGTGAYIFVLAGCHVSVNSSGILFAIRIYPNLNKRIFSKQYNPGEFQRVTTEISAFCRGGG